MTTSLLLDTAAWDLTLDADGNIALASEPYCLAQDVSCAIRTFIGECWYDTSLGITYFDEILGQYPPIALIKKQLTDAAQTVSSEVSNIRVIITRFDQVKRVLTGQVQFTDTTGQTQNVSF